MDNNETGQNAGGRRGGWQGNDNSRRALQDNPAHPPLPAGHGSAVSRVSGEVSALRWWGRLSAVERGRIVAQARGLGLTGEGVPADGEGYGYAE